MHPLKLTCDFLLHPGMMLTDQQKNLWLNKMENVFINDDTFHMRLSASYSLYGLCWCLIMLNVFLIDRQSEKNITALEMNDIKDVTLLGATGFREDMTLANLYILFDYYGKVSIKLITDHYTVTCHKGKQSFTSFPGEDVSLFTQEVSTLVSTTALKYQLEDSAIVPPQKGISNQSMGSTFSVESSGPILVFRGHTQKD